MLRIGSVAEHDPLLYLSDLRPETDEVNACRFSELLFMLLSGSGICEAGFAEGMETEDIGLSDSISDNSQEDLDIETALLAAEQMMSNLNGTAAVTDSSATWQKNGSDIISEAEPLARGAPAAGKADTALAADINSGDLLPGLSLTKNEPAQTPCKMRPGAGNSDAQSTKTASPVLEPAPKAPRTLKTAQALFTHTQEINSRNSQETRFLQPTLFTHTQKTNPIEAPAGLGEVGQVSPGSCYQAYKDFAKAVKAESNNSLAVREGSMAHALRVDTAHENVLKERAMKDVARDVEAYVQKSVAEGREDQLLVDLRRILMRTWTNKEESPGQERTIQSCEGRLIAEPQSVFKQAEDIGADRGQVAFVKDKDDVRKLRPQKKDSGPYDGADAAISHAGKAVNGLAVAHNAEAKVVQVKKQDLPAAVRQIAQEIGPAVREAKKEVHITLTPEKLGRITLKISSGEDGISTKIMTDSLAVKEEFGRQGAMLRETLEGQGIKLSHIEVIYRGDSNGVGLLSEQNHQSRSQHYYQQNQSFKSCTNKGCALEKEAAFLADIQDSGFNYLA